MGKNKFTRWRFDNAPSASAHGAVTDMENPALSDQDEKFFLDAARLRMQGKELDCARCKHFHFAPFRPWCRLHEDGPLARGFPTEKCDDFQLGKPYK